jgi:thioredoxin 1
MLLEIKNNNDLIETIKTNSLTLIDLYADWCSPCKILLPILENISENFKEVSFFKYNVESDEPTILTNMGVKNIPTVLFFINGEEKFRFSGYKDKNFITDQLNRFFFDEKTK